MAESASQTLPPSAANSSQTEEDEEDRGYGVDHLSAVVRPVALTMICASLAVAWVRNPAQDAAISSGLSNYLVYSNQTSSSSSSESSAGDQFGQAVINAIVIVCAVAVATFVLVACYYFRCLKLMVGYLIFASINLLGYTGSFMVISAVQAYHAIFDYATLVFLMLNFAVGGVVAVFWQKGVPRFITQGYLIAVSVIMAWILTKLPEYTSWALLVALALYDLCAVLTPCGPLKALVKLAQERQDPIPGLLYEANVGPERRDHTVHDTFGSGMGRRTQQAGPAAETAERERKRSAASDSALVEADQRSPVPGPAAPRMQAPIHSWDHHGVVTTLGAAEESSLARDPQRQLPPVPSPQPLFTRAGDNASDSRGIARERSSRQPGVFTPAPAAAKDLPPLLPPGDAEPSPLPPAAPAPLSPAAALLRGVPSGYAPVPVSQALPSVSAPKVVPAVAPAAPAPEEDEVFEDDPEDRSIKLGLGDFVFYSVLVSRAALYDFSTFMACLVSVLMGLGGTLLLLGLFKKALPALPISIFLGVTMYFLCALVVTPMFVELTLSGVAV